MCGQGSVVYHCPDSLWGLEFLRVLEHRWQLSQLVWELPFGHKTDLSVLITIIQETKTNLSSISNATADARGRILDADFAEETSELTKHQILTQAPTSMLAQANQSKQGILALLQG